MKGQGEMTLNLYKYCVLIFILLVNEVSAIPMSQKCLPTKDSRLEPHSRLEITCASVCVAENSEEKYEWIHAQRTENGVEDLTLTEVDGSQMVIKSVEYKDGGSYKCRCLPDGPLCEQEVHVNPSIEFVASEKIIFTSDTVDLTCTVHMTHPNASIITSTMSGNTIRQKNALTDAHTSVTFAADIKQGILKDNYVCVMESYSRDNRLMHRLERSLTVYQYTPPEILFTTEYNIGRGDLGKTARLGCTVINSPQIKSKLSWMFNAENLVPLDNGKYSQMIIKDTSELTRDEYLDGGEDGDDVLQYTLLVSDVQLGDVGAYTCQLESDFGIEDSVKVHITFEGRELVDSAEKGSMSYIYVICVVVGVCGLGIWSWCRRRSSKMRKEGRSRNYLENTSSSQPFCEGTMRRKHA